MNILFISHSSIRGGAENVLYNLLKWLPKDKFKIFCIFPAPGPVLNDIKDLGVETFITELKWWASDRQDSPYDALDFCLGLRDRTRRIVELVSTHNIDLIVTNTIVIGEGALAARISKTPHIWYIHEILSQHSGLHAPIPLGLFYSLILSLTESVVVVSEAVKNEIQDHIGNNFRKISVIHNALEGKEKTLLKFEKDNYREEQIIVSAGNICRTKGFLTLLRSAKYVCDQLPNAKFVIAGKVSEKDYYENLLFEREKLGLEDNFTFTGYQEDIYSFYSNASLFVLPSQCEAFGMVLLEAMNAGLPVVATESGGPQEIITNGKNGFLVPVDDEKKMAEKIIYLIRNQEIAQQMGLEASQTIQNEFNYRQYVYSMTNLFSYVFSKYQERNSASNVKMFIEIFNSLGIEKIKLLEAINFCDKVNKSVAAKIYRRLGPLKKMVRKAIGV